MRKQKLNILELFIVLSPFLDLITSFTIYFLKINITIGMIIRFLFLVILLYYLLFKTTSQYKKMSIVYLIIVVIFLSFSFFNVYLLKGKLVLFIELKILLKCFYYPLMLIALLNCSQTKKVTDNILVVVSSIYVLFIGLPIITNTSLLSYTSGKTGFSGWFYSPNEIGALLAILSPFVIAKIISNYNKLYPYLFFLLWAVLLMAIGTKVPFIAPILTIITYIFIYVIRFIISKNKQLLLKPLIFPLGIILFLFMALYQFSTVSNNFTYHKQTLVEPENNLKLQSEDYKNLIFSSRDVYNKVVYKKYLLADLKEQLLGLGYYDINNQFNKQYNNIEIDYGDIFYLYGLIGFIVYFFFMFILIFDLIIIFFRKFKSLLFNDKLIPSYISIFLTIGIAFFAGHVFTSPSVSFYPALIIPFLYLQLDSNNTILSKVNYFCHKYYLIVIISFVLLLLLISLSSFNKKNLTLSLEYQHNKFPNDNLKLINSNNYVLDYLNVEEENKEYEYFHKKIYFRLKHTIRTLDNNDKVIMITIDNLTNKKVCFKIDHLLNNKVKKTYSFLNKEITKEYDVTIGYDKTTLPLNYIEDDKQASYLFAKGFIYKNLIKYYNKNEFSRLKELKEENEKIVLNNNIITNNFCLGPEYSYDYYYISSEQQLFNDENSLNLYIKMFNEGKYSPWMAFDGTYHKLPYSIEPYTKEGYGKNPGSIVPKEVFNNYLFDKSKIFSDLIANANYILLKYMNVNNEGVWFTEYTSTWLKNDYEIHAPYIDTRHNENIGNYLLEIGKYLNNEQLISLSFNYANYLISEYNDQNLIILNNNILFPDYFSSHHEKKTHASLNHQLGIINYLFKCYNHTKYEPYKELGLLLLKTIEINAQEWIKENGDLWYQVDENNIYSGEDYKILTLNDLVTVQENIKLIMKKESLPIKQLIKSKYNYLKGINYSIPNNIIIKGEI